MNTINLSQETSDEIELNKQGLDWLEMARTASKMAQKGKKNGQKWPILKNTQMHVMWVL